MNHHFQIQYVVTSDRDAVRNSATEFEYRVVHLASSKVVMSFAGERHCDARGEGASGILSCMLIEQHGMVMTKDQAGNIEHHHLSEALH